jgi:enoyl-CoA hydratase/carnithine racemase
MPDEVEGAITQAVRDPEVKVIVLRGAGRAFCAGYDFGGGFHHWDELLSTDGEWDPGKDFIGTISTGNRAAREDQAGEADGQREPEEDPDHAACPPWSRAVEGLGRGVGGG